MFTNINITVPFQEVFQLLCEPSRNIEEKEIVELFKDVFKRCFTDELVCSNFYRESIEGI